jgi:hypothetical protein
MLGREAQIVLIYQGDLMKIRTGFVSNSSSSSFVVNLAFPKGFKKTAENLQKLLFAKQLADGEEFLKYIDPYGNNDPDNPEEEYEIAEVAKFLAENLEGPWQLTDDDVYILTGDWESEYIDAFLYLLDRNNGQDGYESPSPFAAVPYKMITF